MAHIDFKAFKLHHVSVLSFFSQEISVPMNRGKYNLYAYTEGQTMEKIKSLKFYGTPVVFIPGHSGSYRQGTDVLIYVFHNLLFNS